MGPSFSPAQGEMALSVLLLGLLQTLWGSELVPQPAMEAQHGLKCNLEVAAFLKPLLVTSCQHGSDLTSYHLVLKISERGGRGKQQQPPIRGTAPPLSFLGTSLLPLPSHSVACPLPPGDLEPCTCPAVLCHTPDLTPPSNAPPSPQRSAAALPLAGTSYSAHVQVAASFKTMSARTKTEQHRNKPKPNYKK